MFGIIRETLEAEHGKLSPVQVNQLHQLVGQTDFTQLKGDPANVMRQVTQKYVAALWPVRSGFKTMSGPVSESVMKVQTHLHQHKKAYLCLDSFNRRVNNDNQSTIYSWYYTEYRSTTPGFVTTTAPLSNITSIRLYQPSLPAWPQLNATGRVSIYFREFGIYAYLSSNSQPYHYLLRYTPSAISNRFVDLNLEEFNNGIFIFHKPITKLDTLSISFGNPNETIIFNNDRDTGTVTAYGATTTFTMSQPHNLVTGDVVYISGFATLTPGYDAGINNTLGYQITYINTTSFRIAVNTSSGSIWIPNARVTCFYAPFRVILPLEITYAGQTSTLF